MTTERQKQKLAVLEAMLFTTEEPLSIEALQKNLRLKRESVEALLKILSEKYSSPDSGVKLSEIGGYRLTVKPEFTEHVSHLTPHADLSRGLLRVLALVMKYEPIKQSDIVKVVGNRTYEYVKDLEERGFIKREKSSRTNLLRTTPQFEEYFGVRKKSIKKELDNLEKNELNRHESGHTEKKSHENQAQG
jgi:segregation and condensation protein B